MFLGRSYYGWYMVVFFDFVCWKGNCCCRIVVWFWWWRCVIFVLILVCRYWLFCVGFVLCGFGLVVVCVCCVGNSNG